MNILAGPGSKIQLLYSMSVQNSTVGGYIKVGVVAVWAQVLLCIFATIRAQVLLCIL
jgi:hypothetical protein